MAYPICQAVITRNRVKGISGARKGIRTVLFLPRTDSTTASIRFGAMAEVFSARLFFFYKKDPVHE